MNITKIIIPAAGIGSRFLPITKSIPKEMLPIANKPAIQYIVQEAVDAQLKELLIILSPDKQVIRDYFSPNLHLETILKQHNQMHYVQDLYKLLGEAQYHYFIQNKPLGLAHALLHAAVAIQPEEFFAVALPDDIIVSKIPEIAQLMQWAITLKSMIIAVQEVPYDAVSAYGIIEPGCSINEQITTIASLVEKPHKDEAPSRLAIVGRYIFHHDLFSYIPKTKPKNGEILLPDTINAMIKAGYTVYAYKIQGARFDTGTPQGWLSCINSIMKP